MEYDVVVIGSGAGGLAAALTANTEGQQVLVLEKTDRIGGATAVSGGGMWIRPLSSCTAVPSRSVMMAPRSANPAAAKNSLTAVITSALSSGRDSIRR